MGKIRTPASLPSAAGYLAVSLGLILGNLTMVQATYECSMSGERNTSGCCCSGSVECHAGEKPERPSRPALRGVCCSVHYETTLPSGSASRAGLVGGWKQALDDGRGPFCALEPLVAPSTSAVTGSGCRVLAAFAGRAHGSDPPLYLVHRALLI